MSPHTKMRKQIIQIIAVINAIFIVANLASCNKPILSKEILTIEASLFLENEQPQLALDLLNEHAGAYPNDTELLKLKGQSYLLLNDPEMAANVFDQTLLLNPSDTSLLLLSFQSKKQAGLDFSNILIQVAQEFPNTLMPTDWLQVSDLLAIEGNYQEAINAQFRALGTNKLTNDTPADSALKIAQYYKNLKNDNAALPWFESVSKSESIDAFTASLDLIEIHSNNENWEALKSVVNAFKTRFPGALESTQYAQIESLIAQSQKVKNKKPSTALTLNKSSINDIKDLEALANKIVERASTTEQADDTLEAEYNPDILIQPADPDLEATNLNGLSTEISEKPFVPLSPSEIEIMLVKANNALLENNLEIASELFETILKSDPSRHSIWNRLSQIHQSNNDLESATQAVLEAIKLSPNTINYTINYLQISGKTKSTEQVLFDLISASKRFPNSPEITLSLARAYDRIRNSFRAIELYKKFITLAPNHPLRPEAENAIIRLTN